MPCVIWKCSNAPFHAWVIVGNLKISVGVRSQAVEFQLAVVAKDVHEHSHTIAHEQVIVGSTKFSPVILQSLPATVTVHPLLDPLQCFYGFRRIDDRVALSVDQWSTIEICPEWVEASVPEREEGNAIIRAICIFLIKCVSVFE